MKPQHLIFYSAALVLSLLNSTLAAPANLVQVVTYNSETITMRLDLDPLRGANFELWSQNATGGYDVVTPVDERSYTGTVDGYPGAVSCGVLQDDGLFRGAVYFDRGVTWFTLGAAVVQTRALDYGSFSNFQVPGAPTVAAGQAGTYIYAYDLGVDADYNYFTTSNSLVAKAFESIEYSVCLNRAIYMRDVLLRPYLGRVIVRSTLAEDPYTGLTQGNYLDAVRTEWNTNHTDTDPDLVAGVSPTKIGGGLAWVGVVGTSSGYSVNQCNSSGNFDVVFRHEMGHNWGCGHFVGGSPEGAGLMGGNAPGRFSGCEVFRTLDHRDNRIAAGGILDNEGVYTAIELPPYASMDAAVYVQSVDTSITIPVLANDHDANGQTVSLLSHDGVSDQGGTVTQQGQDLVYTAPGAYLGTDYFFYIVTDTVGRTATGVAIIDVQSSDDLRLYLPLDETTGTTATDYSIFANSATLSGTDFSAATGPGKFANAVSLDGVDDHVAVSNVKVNSNTVTITGWVKQGATQNAWAGIAFDRSGGAAGLNIGTGTELRYHWNNGNWGWNSGLIPPADTWTFVALVVEPSKATIYMNSGGGFQSAVNTASHSPATFGTTYLGWDPSNASRHFDGAIDDVRIYNHALTFPELQDVHDGGGASSPNPFDGASEVTTSLLRWSPGATATSYEVYVGTSAAAVGSANQSSIEYKGSTSAPQFLAFLTDQTQYFWRVDTVTATTALPGQVWSFTTSTVPFPGNTIAINFGDGGGQNFSGGELIGPTSADSTHWNQATGASGTLAALVDDAGAATGAEVQWFSANTWTNNDGTADDEHRLAVGYLDDPEGSNGDGKGVLVTLNNIPYDTYRVYGLFASDQNQTTGSCGVVNFDVNGTWALGGNATTTAAAWGTINSNNSNNGSFWTEIVPGSVQGNYWLVNSNGPTCSITGELGNGANRGSLTGVIIEDTTPPTNNPPQFSGSTITGAPGTPDVPYSGTLDGTAADPDPGDTLTFSKQSGPAWLSVAGNGALSGTPTAGDVGSNAFTVRVTDVEGLFSEATLDITIHNPAPPLVHLRFDEGNGLTAADSTGNGWDGSLQGGTGWATGGAGRINDAVTLDGSDDHLTFAPGVADGLTDFTASAWVYWNGGALDGQRIFDFGTGTNSYMFLTPRSQGAGPVRFAITTSGILGEQAISGSAVLPAGAWTHVAVTLSGTTGTLYVNGAAVGNNNGITLTPSSLGVTTQNYLGRSQSAADPYYSGRLDEFLLLDRALNPNEVADLASPPQPPTSLAATPGDGTVSLTWDAVAGATSYSIKRAIASGGPYLLVSTVAPAPNYLDTGVTNGTTYYYVVTANSPPAESAHSTEVATTPLSPLQSWRLANFGTIANTGNAADDADPDGDGMTNIDEFNAGTDPNDPASFLAITALAENGNDLLVSFPTVSGKTYLLEWSSTLQPGAWTVVLTNATPQENIPGTGGLVQITDTNGAQQAIRLYRVGVE